jgi:anti-anti-sigma regulatory factor
MTESTDRDGLENLCNTIQTLRVAKEQSIILNTQSSLAHIMQWYNFLPNTQNAFAKLTYVRIS